MPRREKVTDGDLPAPQARQAGESGFGGSGLIRRQPRRLPRLRTARRKLRSCKRYPAKRVAHRVWHRLPGSASAERSADGTFG